MREFKPEAYMSLTNHGGIAIMLINDEAVVCSVYDYPPTRPLKLYYTKSGDAYFKLKGRRYHLKNFLRIH